MEKQLLHETFANLLISIQHEHKFGHQKISVITEAILSTSRSSLNIHEQIQSIIKRLKENWDQQDKRKKAFNSYELQWIMNWLIQVYYRHVKLIQYFERDFLNNEKNENPRQQNKLKKGRELLQIELSVDAPAFVQPLSRAKIIREESTLVIVNSDDPQEQIQNIPQSQ